MLSDKRRADLLARTGPVLAVLLCEASGRQWVFVPQDRPDFAVLSRCEDNMAVGMMPGWFEPTARFEFSPFIHMDGGCHTLASLGLVQRGGASLRIHASMTSGPEALATDLLRRLIGPYQPYFQEVQALRSRHPEARKAQPQAADLIAATAGGAQRRGGDEINPWPDVCGVSLPLRVLPGGIIELGRAKVTAAQVSAIVAGLQRADRLRPARRLAP